jgi:hypothetical protein
MLPYAFGAVIVPAACLLGYVMGYDAGRREMRDELAKVLGDFGKLARELAEQLLGKRS